MSTIDPNLTPVLAITGGGSSLPVAPSAALLDAGAPDTVVMLDAGGVGSAVALASFANLTAEMPSESATYTGASSGWTVTNGNGTASASGTAYAVSFASGTAPSVSPASTNPRLVRSITDTFKPLLSRWTLTARVASAPDDANYRLSVAVGATDLSAGVACVVARTGSTATVELGVYSPSYSAAVSAGGAIPVDGTGWVRMTYAGNRVTLEYGAGTTTAQPETWTTHGSAVASHAWESQILYLTRWAGANGLGGSWDDITIAGYP